MCQEQAQLGDGKEDEWEIMQGDNKIDFFFPLQSRSLDKQIYYPWCVNTKADDKKKKKKKEVLNVDIFNEFFSYGAALWSGIWWRDIKETIFNVKLEEISCLCCAFLWHSFIKYYFSSVFCW